MNGKIDRPTDDDRLPVTYILPLAAPNSQARALTGYIRRLSRQVAEVIVVDGSPPAVYREHAGAWGEAAGHIPPAFKMTNGKVAGVVTGLNAARHDYLIIADDDVRYRASELRRMVAELGAYDVVRPQNYFVPSPWHARWDTARTLFNRLSGGDWPGTLGVRRNVLMGTGGYSGEALFENLELVRTIKASGGREKVVLDLFVARRPPSANHFLSQRVRQAYDEWARPGRLAAQLMILPTILALVWLGPHAFVGVAVISIAVAEVGRRVGSGTEVFPATSALWAPLWLAERSVTAWIALGLRVLLGGVTYRGKRVKDAATPLGKLRHTLTYKYVVPD